MPGKYRHIAIVFCLCSIGLAFNSPDAAYQSDSSSPGANDQLPIIFRAACFYDSPRRARVLVAARIRLEKTVFKKKQEKLQTDLNIMGTAYAEGGGISARFSQTLPVSFDERQEAGVRGRGLKYRNYFRLRPGKYRLKLAVSDDSGHVGSSELFMEVPVLPDQELASSSIVITEQASRLPDLIRNLQSQLLDESDPLLYGGFEIDPSVENRLQTGSVIPLMYRMYNLSGPSDQWDLTAKAKLLDESAKEYALAPISLKKAVSPLGNGEAAVAVGLSFQGVPPGKYQLIIETTEAAVGQSAITRTDVEFAGANPSEKTGTTRDSSREQASVDAEKKTVSEMTEKELRRSYRDQLRSLKFDENQELLEGLLKRVGDNVQAFLRDLSNTASKEKITMKRMVRLSNFGIVPISVDPGPFNSRVEEYQYLILKDSEKPESSLIEARSDKENRSVDLLKGIEGFMVSLGYAGHCLYFDPSHQSNADLRYLGRETGRQRNHVIAFAQKPESGDYLSCYYDSSSSNIIRFLVQGFAWVTPDTYQISRIYTTLLSLETPSSLMAASADVVYQKITFGDNPREFWLPKDVQVVWEFLGRDYIRTYMTQHRYSDYHLFTVEADYEISDTAPKE